MTEIFMQPDYFAGISDAVMIDMQRRLLRGSENDSTIIKATYTTYVLREYAESFCLSAGEVAGLTVDDDGTGTTAVSQFTGAPSLAEFVDYIRQGR